MFRIQLDSTRRMELGVAGGVLLLLALVVWWQWNWWTGTVPPTIVEYTTEVPHGANLHALPTVKDPIDPKHTEQLTVFATNGGKLEFSRFPALPAQTEVRFIDRTQDPRRRGAGGAFGAPFEKASQERDKARMMATWACYCIAEGRSWAFAVRPADPTPDQNKSLRDLAADLKDRLQEFDASRNDGSFEPRQYKQLEDMLAAYRKLDGEAAKQPDSAKARMAWKIYDAGRTYAADFDAKRDELVVACAKKMVALFDEKQQDKLAKAADRYTSRLRSQTAGG